MREAKIVVALIQGELLPQAILPLTQRAHPAADRRHMLTHGQVEALHERRIDLPAARRSHLLDGFERAEDDAVLHLHQPATPYSLDDLCIEELGQRHPAGLRSWPCSLTALRLHPPPIVRQQGRYVLPKAVRQEEGHTVGR